MVRCAVRHRQGHVGVLKLVVSTTTKYIMHYSEIMHYYALLYNNALIMHYFIVMHYSYNNALIMHYLSMVRCAVRHRQGHVGVLKLVVSTTTKYILHYSEIMHY
jgi:hypothetical protein